MLLYQEESFVIRIACFTIYSTFRNTQKEVVYLNALLKELQLNNLSVEKEKQLPVFHRQTKVGTYVPDIVINGKIIIELKAKPLLHKEDIRQFWYYLKNSEYRLGFLINFGEPNGVNIIRRVYDEARQRGSAYNSA